MKRDDRSMLGRTYASAGHVGFSILVTLTALWMITSTSCRQGPRYEGPRSPEESLHTFQFSDSFRAEVFAAEPLVIDPVSMEFDEQGDAWVVGMLDAYKPDSVKGRGCIVRLQDRDGDGRADTSIVFADSLREATSILPWQGGLLVTAAPHILYLKDTDGDGRADSKEIVFTGFFNKNEEAQITNLRFGIDNWIYANNHGQAGDVRFNRSKDTARMSMRGWDFRFRLDRNQFGQTTGRGQFGLAMDDWGHRFYTQNQEHISQVVIQRKYIVRNPYLPKTAASAMLNISDHDPIMFQLTPPPYWRAERTKQRNQKSRENGMPEKEFAEDHFTGGSGGTYYGATLFPKEYQGSIFTGDVAGNLVHRDILKDIDSPYYKAQRGGKEKDREFMATTDSWVRAASFTVGPDGSLFMIDMYRQHIETPLSIPADLQVGMDFSAGDKYGRIYRIVPKSAPRYKWPATGLRNAPSADLVALLAHENQWWRLQAQRLLLERKDPAAIPLARKLFSEHPDARARLHALYVLEGADALNAADVMKALKDKDPGIRENAAVLAERFPECMPLLFQCMKDPSVRVALQATLSAGDGNGQTLTTALADVLVRHGASPWFRTAVLSSTAGSSAALLKELAARKDFFGDTAVWKRSFVRDISMVITSRNNPEERQAIERLMNDPYFKANPLYIEAVKNGTMEASSSKNKKTP